MKIKFLKAGSGDAILIHEEDKNILIDGGNDDGWQFLQTEVDKIFDEGQLIDILIITHHDDDHIKGIINLLQYIKDKDIIDKQPIKKVYFNSPRLIKGLIPLKDDCQNLSYKQASDIEILLTELGIQQHVANSESKNEEIGHLKIRFLSPLQSDLDNYASQKGAYLSSDDRCDWGVPLATLLQNTDDASQDKSPSNQTSIVTSIECGGRKILLTGDVTPSNFERLINELAIDQGDIIKYDYVKLPHHGSYRSLNENIIKKLDCTNFIVSTNSRKHFLPNKRAFIKLIKSLPRDIGTTINFHFNYGEVIQKLNINAREQREHNIKLIANNANYGFSI